MNSKNLKIMLGVALLFMGGAMLGAQTGALTPLFPCSGTIDDPYGISADLTRNSGEFRMREQAMGKFSETGAAFLRVPMSWDNLYRNGLFQYDIYDAAMETVKDYPVSLVGTISAIGGNGINAWTKPAEYAAYLKELFTRYRFYLNIWEAIPNVDAMKVAGKNIEPLQYLSVLKGIYVVAKAVNPENRLVVGGQSNLSSAFLDSLCAAGGHNYFDILSVSTFQKPERIPSICSTISEKMARYEVSKPVWITSFSANSAPGNEEAEFRQAACIARAHILAFACGVDKLFWNCLRSSEADPMVTSQYNGLYHPDFSTKPAVKAYKALMQMLPAGSTRPAVQMKSGNYLASWTRPDGSAVWAAWNPSGRESVPLLITGKAKLYEYTGSKYKAKTIENLDNGAVFIVGAESVIFDK